MRFGNYPANSCDLHREFLRWHKNVPQGKHRDSNDLRFGQWLCNQYVNDSWPELFYAENKNEAYSIAFIELLRNGK